jgi:CelD/BcsL family acetyltransferase involved in cellulose biosynthesis
MSGPTVSWEPDLAGFGNAGGDLAALVASVPGTTFFNTWEWLSCAASALPPGRSLHVLAIRENGTLVACVPLTWGSERLHGVPVRSVRLLGDPLADRVGLLVAGEDDDRRRRFVLDAIVEFPKPWDVILLSELVEDPGLRALVRGWAHERGIGVHWRHCARSPVLALGQADVRALRASYPKTLTTRLRRSRKRLEAAGKVEFERRLPGPGDVERVLDAFKAIEDASWKGEREVGIFSTAGRYRFFRALSEAIARRGWLDVGMLSLDGRLISYRYGFRFQGVYLDYNLAYAPEFARLSPGRILLDEMITSSLELGLAAVDASRGAVGDGHQLQEWTDRYVDHYQLWVLAGSARGRLLLALRQGLRPALQRVRDLVGRRERRPA